ncbi:MAG TPA: PKD domain-containing protein, partial [Bacteroidales bacterium]|nr:PKD domain-containing protein [Bacteroidales bacterium]
TKTRTKPHPAFNSPNPVGFPPQDVEFANNTLFAGSVSWDFGDGSNVSTEMNPVHTYTQAGTYTVTLTATNELGDSVLQKTDFVKINERPELPVGEMLYGGNMEDPNLWNITNLNETSSTTATWNYTGDSPIEGEGGCLYLSGAALNNQSQYAIWQPIELNADSAYNFNAAFKALTEIKNFWAEAFIGTEPPVDGEDYGADSIKIAMFSSWADCNGSAVDGTYQSDGCILMPDFSPEETGTYYFVLKVGCIDWENNPVAFEVLLDDVSLQESKNVPKPAADFFTDVTSGPAPLTVYFTDLSVNATEWSWDFGDETTSTEQHPSHTYNDSGTFTVRLVAINQTLSDTMIVENLIEVSSTESIFDQYKETLKVYPNPSNGMIRIAVPANLEGNLTVTNVLGSKVYEQEVHGDRSLIMLEIEKRGLYFVKLQTSDKQYISKVVIDY